MQADKLHKPAVKFEKLLLLYYLINKKNAEDQFYHENKKDYLLERELGVSRLTLERYINIFLETDRVYVESEDNWGKFLANDNFLSLEEMHEYLKKKEIEWTNKGKSAAERTRLLHLIRLIGWMDLFYKCGRISEMELKRYYSDSAGKRLVQRDFKLLRELEGIHMNIHRKFISLDNGHKQWFYVIH